MTAAGAEGESAVVGCTISEEGGIVPVDAGLCSSGVFWAWEEEGCSSGVEAVADDGAAATDEVGSSGTELTIIVVVVGSSGVELGADDGAAATDEVGSSGTELTTIVVVVGSSGVELGAEDGTTTTVDVVSSGVVIGAAAGLEETISGVVSTGALDGAGADETCSGVVEDERSAGEEELPVLDGG